MTSADTLERIALRNIELPSTYQLETAVKEQQSLLQDIHALLQTPAPSQTDYLSESFANLITGQTTLSRHISNISHLLSSKSEQLAPVIEALQQARTDLDLRKASEGHKDQLISTLRSQTEELRVNLGVIEADRAGLRTRVEDLKKWEQQWDREKAVLMARSATAEKLSEEVRGKTDENEATKMALLAERDGVAQALRESFDRLKGTETELLDVQREVSCCIQIFLCSS